MSNARNLARLIVDSGGDVDVSSLGNVPPSNDASALTTGTLGSARLPAGSVLQVKQAVVHGTQQATTSTSFIDATGLTVDITPTSASSKILVMAHIEAGMGASGANTTNRYQVVRNGTFIGMQSARHYDYGGTGVYGAQSIALTILDAPATTSSVTYKVQLQFLNGSNAFINAENGSSSITVMEISA